MNKANLPRPQDAQDRFTDDGNPTCPPGPNMAQQIAKAACGFEQQRTGILPGSVTVVLSNHTLVITLYGVLSLAEHALARTPAGAVQVQEFHRQLFANASDSFKLEIKRITGADVCESMFEVAPIAAPVPGVFATGTMVQVHLLAHAVPLDCWSEDTSDNKDYK